MRANARVKVEGEGLGGGGGARGAREWVVGTYNPQAGVELSNAGEAWLAQRMHSSTTTLDWHC